jgi:hypothetical protein
MTFFSSLIFCMLPIMNLLWMAEPSTSAITLQIKRKHYLIIKVLCSVKCKSGKWCEINLLLTKCYHFFWDFPFFPMHPFQQHCDLLRYSISSPFECKWESGCKVVVWAFPKWSGQFMLSRSHVSVYLLLTGTGLPYNGKRARLGSFFCMTLLVHVELVLFCQVP